MPVGSYGANRYGLFDIAGNVWEWVWDWYGDYGQNFDKDPRGPKFGTKRILRGGSWYHNADVCRIASRNPGIMYINFGFRSVLPPGQP